MKQGITPHAKIVTEASADADGYRHRDGVGVFMESNADMWDGGA